MGRLGLPIVTVLMLFVTPALADVVTVCGMPNQFSNPDAHVAPLAKLSQALAGSRDRSGPGSAPQIALARDPRGFDVVLNWHDEDEQSLRASGADIFDMELGANLVHLMVARDAENLEHFLFSLDGDGAGELLWNSATGESDARTSRSVCAKPR